MKIAFYTWINNNYKDTNNEYSKKTNRYCIPGKT